MNRAKLCLTLTGKTLAEDLETLEKYRQYVDIAELRADFLLEDERLNLRQFPRLAGMPCVLTIRRKIDGGLFDEGDAARTVLFARALSFADADRSKNFQYIDFEEDFHVASLQDAALAFGTRIIRSVHDMKNPITDIRSRLEELVSSSFEIPKIAFMPHSLDDVRRLFMEAQSLKDNNHILVAMGPMGLPSRLLATRLKNYLTYTSPAESMGNTAPLSHLDPIVMNDVYHFRQIDDETKIFGITGWPLKVTSSPELHNRGYESHHINAVYIPVAAEKFEQALDFANCIGIQGMSVTVPHKESVLNFVPNHDERVEAIGASNTILKKGSSWYAYNTDAMGFARALLEFTGLKSLKGKHVAIIGAGGAARAIAYAVKKLGGKACIFNRTIRKAQILAEAYGFKYAPLTPESGQLLHKYSNIIIQTTSKGMNCSGPSTVENDPLTFYEFSGKEYLFDIIYVPATTPVMARAMAAGCRVCNGYNMLQYQGYRQFEIFTGTEF